MTDLAALPLAGHRVEPVPVRPAEHRLRLTRRIHPVAVPARHDTRSCNWPMTIPDDYRRGRHAVSALIEYPPKICMSTLVNSLKGVSARRLRAEFTGRVNRASMHGHFWSPSYFAASCGAAPPSIIRQYIEQQRRPA